MRLAVSFSEIDRGFNVNFSEINRTFDPSIWEAVVVKIVNDVDPYEGSYEVTPKVTAQTIPTAQKFLTEDMRINSIPYHDVKNTSGGNTIFIGNEV